MRGSCASARATMIFCRSPSLNSLTGRFANARAHCRDRPAHAFVIVAGQPPRPVGVGMPAERHQVVGGQDPRLDTVGQHDADAPRALARRQVRERVTADEHLAGERRLHAGERAHQRRLAGAIGSQEAHELSWRERRSEMLRHGRPRASVADGELAHREQRCGHRGVVERL